MKNKMCVFAFIILSFFTTFQFNQYPVFAESKIVINRPTNTLSQQKAKAEAEQKREQIEADKAEEASEKAAEKKTKTSTNYDSAATDYYQGYGANTSTLQGEQLSTNGMYLLLNAIESNYGQKLSQQREDEILRGLSIVGKIEYSQAHHTEHLFGLNPTKYNDCSGFVSDVVGISKNTTASFWNDWSHEKTSDKTPVPGDILLHYNGAAGDGAGDHALIYLGKFTDGNVVMDCSNHGVTVRTIRYFDECYFISLPAQTWYTTNAKNDYMTTSVKKTDTTSEKSKSYAKISNEKANQYGVVYGLEDIIN